MQISQQGTAKYVDRSIPGEAEAMVNIFRDYVFQCDPILHSCEHFRANPRASAHPRLATWFHVDVDLMRWTPSCTALKPACGPNLAFVLFGAKGGFYVSSHVSNV